jgi:hypothetical protein
MDDARSRQDQWAINSVVQLPTAWVCSRSLAGVLGSKVCVFWRLCFFQVNVGLIIRLGESYGVWGLQCVWSRSLVMESHERENVAHHSKWNVNKHSMNICTCVLNGLSPHAFKLYLYTNILLHNVYCTSKCCTVMLFFIYSPLDSHIRLI